MVDFLFISTNDWTPWGGSEVLWSQTAINLLDKGYDVAFYAKYWKKKPAHYQELENRGCKIIYRERQDNTFSHKIFKTLFNTFSTKRIWEKTLISINPKVIVLSSGNHGEGTKWSEIARQLNIKYLLIIQLVTEFNFSNDNHLNELMVHYQTAEKIYFVSEQNAQLLQEILAINLNNYQIISNPFRPLSDQDKFDYPSTEEGYFLAFVANLYTVHKGQDILFKVLSSKKWKERELFINMYGDGPHAKYLIRLAKYYNLERVFFKGYEPNQSKIWTSNHGLILCSRMEGLSLALLESMFYKRVSIVTNVGDAKEFIRDSVTGFIASGAIDEFVDDTLERAWQRRTDWKEMGKKASEILEMKIPYDPVGKLTEALISSLN